MNKNVSIWRGILPPPTHSHLWVIDDSNIKIYRNGLWQPIFDDATSEHSGFMSKSDKVILELLNENLHWN